MELGYLQTFSRFPSQLALTWRHPANVPLFTSWCCNRISKRQKHTRVSSVLSQWLKRWVDIMPLNREWQDVQIASNKSYQWVKVVRKELLQEITTALRRPGRPTCLLGVKGSGKRTLIDQMQSSLEQCNHIDNRASSTSKGVVFNCETTVHSAFFPFLTTFYGSLSQQLGTELNGLTLPCPLERFIFDAVLRKSPKFGKTLASYYNDVLRGAYPPPAFRATEADSKSIMLVPTQNLFQMWGLLLCAPASTFSQSPFQLKPQTLQKILFLLTTIGEHEENIEAYRLSDGAVQHFPTGKWSLPFLLYSMDALGELYQRSSCKSSDTLPLIFILHHVELIARSGLMHRLGEEFLLNLLKISSGLCGFSCLVTTDDSLLVIRLRMRLLACDPLDTSKKVNPIKNTICNVKPIASSDPTNSFLAGESQLPCIQIAPWPQALCAKVLRDHYTDDDLLIQAAWQAVGGNPSLLRRLAEGLAEIDCELRREVELSKGTKETGEIGINKSVNAKLLQELRVPSCEIQDLPSEPLAQEVVDYERLQRSHHFMRTALQRHFCKEMLHFQWKMNQFLSLTLMQQLRRACPSQVVFFVIVLESVRIFLSKPYWVLPDVEKVIDISHPVILGLLDAKILAFRLKRPVRLEVYDALHAHFLSSFINQKMNALNATDRALYSATAQTSSKFLKTRMQNMTWSWEPPKTGVAEVERDGDLQDMPCASRGIQ